MGEKQETFLTTLDGAHASWVKSLAQLFGSRAAALAMCVKIVKAAMDDGILPRDLYELKSLVANKSNDAIAPQAGAQPGPAASDVSADMRKPPRRVYRPASRLRRESEAVASAITPFPASALSFQPSASVAG